VLPNSVDPQAYLSRKTVRKPLASLREELAETEGSGRGEVVQLRRAAVG